MVSVDRRPPTTGGPPRQGGAPPTSAGHAADRSRAIRKSGVSRWAACLPEPESPRSQPGLLALGARRPRSRAGRVPGRPSGGAVVFAFAHGINAVLITALVVGLVAGELRRHSGSIWPGVMVHIVNNSLVAIITFVLAPSS
ncbi:CPBP family intramembrane glutamic endopeptidase [Nonomuraea sp. NPDC050404]|uniref:CPBP family intramembrane glutamic endopeptidase n=1 Tax=Nonomuraea sp. NPDC050404 TaxID=3155783 RepID=UPI00340A7FE5